MGKWLDLAREIDRACAVSAVSADSTPNCTKSANCNDAPTIASDISSILHGLDRLRAGSVVRGMSPTVWRAYISDALWLVESGVASDALERGWGAIDLFGISADERWLSLAAWIGGRRDEHGRACILLTEIRGEKRLPYAVHVRDGRHSWHYLTPAPSDAVLPWMM